MKVKCSYCSICMEKKPSKLKRDVHSFCNKICHNKWMSENQSGSNSPSYKDGLRGTVLITCDKCGKTFYRKLSAVKKNKHYFCSRKCFGEFSSLHYIGTEHSQWKGGLTLEKYSIRNRKSYKDWRTMIFERDKYRCQFCWQKGGKLNAHHILPFSEFPKLREDQANGITLCEDCHKIIHKG